MIYSGYTWLFKPYYPKDLVDYARSQYTPLDQQGNTESDDTRLRCVAGEICPQSGEWYSPANNMEKRHFDQGETMPEIPNNPWGETILYLDLSHWYEFKGTDEVPFL